MKQQGGNPPRLSKAHAETLLGRELGIRAKLSKTAPWRCEGQLGQLFSVTVSLLSEEGGSIIRLRVSPLSGCGFCLDAYYFADTLEPFEEWAEKEYEQLKWDISRQALGLAEGVCSLPSPDALKRYQRAAREALQAHGKGACGHAGP